MSNSGRLFIFCIIATFAIVLAYAFSTMDKHPTTIPQHRCIDPTHELCDGHCECDGLGCHLAANNNTTSIELLREYQIELSMDSIIIYDGNRVVGSVAYGNSPIDSVFLRDNE